MKRQLNYAQNNVPGGKTYDVNQDKENPQIVGFSDLLDTLVNIFRIEIVVL